jgi:hypothetical protein
LSYCTMRKLLIVIMLLSSAVLYFGCKRADENLRLRLNTDVMESKVIINVFDAATGQAVPANLKVKVQGEGAANLFTFAGDKSFKYEDGRIIIAVRSLNPTGPVSFSVSLSGTGYLPVSSDIAVHPGQTHYEASVSMVNISKPPSDLEVKSYTMTVNATGLARQYTAHAKPSEDVYMDDQLASVVFPANCKFHYYKDVNGLPVATLKSAFETPSGSGEVRDIFEQRTDIPLSLLEKTNYTGTMKAYFIRSKTDVTVNGTRLTVIEKTKGLNDPSDPGNVHSRNVKTLLGETASNGDIVLHSVAKAPFAALLLVGTVGSEDVLLAPDPEAKWFASFVLDPNAINPVTNKPVSEEDLIDRSEPRHRYDEKS